MPRKPKPKTLKQNKVIALRVTSTEIAAIARAAKLSRMPMATYVRILALDNALRVEAAS